MRHILLILVGISALLGSLWWLRTAEDPLELVFHVELWVWALIFALAGVVMTFVSAEKWLARRELP